MVRGRSRHSLEMWPPRPPLTNAALKRQFGVSYKSDKKFMGADKKFSSLDWLRLKRWISVTWRPRMRQCLRDRKSPSYLCVLSLYHLKIAIWPWEKPEGRCRRREYLLILNIKSIGHFISGKIEQSLSGFWFLICCYLPKWSHIITWPFPLFTGWQNNAPI